MISYITGIVKEVDEQRIVIDMGNIALAICVPSQRLFIVGNTVTMHTHMHWNAEQGPTLYGFQTSLERMVFLMIISCSGLGPKIGLAILEHMGPKVFLQAIQTGNESTLSAVSGIGQKKAATIIVQLRHKVEKCIKSGVELVSVGGALEQWNNVAEVLGSLNYSRTEITQTMRYLGDTYAGQSIAFDQLMRKALSFLAQKG